MLIISLGIAVVLQICRLDSFYVLSNVLTKTCSCASSNCQSGACTAPASGSGTSGTGTGSSGTGSSGTGSSGTGSGGTGSGGTGSGGTGTCSAASSTFTDCANGGDNTYYSPAGNPTDVYQILCGLSISYDATGPASIHVTSLSECIAQCESFVPTTDDPQPCVAVNYYNGTNNQDNCNLHYSATTNSTSNEFNSAVKVNCTGGGYGTLTCLLLSA